MRHVVRRTASGFAAMVLMFAMAMAVAGPALAHEEKEVGPYHLAVGFGDEPAYAGIENSVQMLLSFSSNDKPVVDLKTDALKVTVEFGNQSLDLPMEPLFEVGEFGLPGDYRAFFIPTRPGTYAFHLTGSINGTNVDETFTSGPQSFSDVLDPSDIQFPVKDPSVSDVATRVARETARLNQGLAAAQVDIKTAKDEASSAKTLGFVGIAVGVVGLAIAIVALATRPHAPITAGTTQIGSSSTGARG